MRSEPIVIQDLSLREVREYLKTFPKPQWSRVAQECGVSPAWPYHFMRGDICNPTHDTLARFQRHKAGWRSKGKRREAVS